MTSAVSREDLESKFWEFARHAGVAGGRVSRSQIDRLLLYVDQYTYARARYLALQGALPAPDPDPYGYIRPGKGDPDAGKARCGQCERVKEMDTAHFNRDTKNPYGYRLSSCKVCRAKKLPQPAFPISKPTTSKKYKCRTCGEMKTLHDFPIGKRINPSLSVMCLSCENEKSQSLTTASIA